MGVDPLTFGKLLKQASIEPACGAKITTPEGEFTLIAYTSAVDPVPHLVLSCGGVGVPDASGRVPEISDAVLVRMHRRDLLGDIFGVAARGGKSSADDLRASMRATLKTTFPAFSQIAVALSFGITPSSAWASQARSSTSSQASYFAWSVQMFPIAGRV